MAICFTQPIQHGGDRLHLDLPIPGRWPPRLPGLNLGKYNIQDGCGFGLPQAIFAVKRGNYNLMILTETKIPDTL